MLLQGKDRTLPTLGKHQGVKGGLKREREREIGLVLFIFGDFCWGLYAILNEIGTTATHRCGAGSNWQAGPTLAFLLPRARKQSDGVAAEFLPATKEELHPCRRIAAECETGGLPPQSPTSCRPFTFATWSRPCWQGSRLTCIFSVDTLFWTFWP